MNRNGMQQAILSLASSNITERHLLEFETWLRKSNPGILANTVREVRNAALGSSSSKHAKPNTSAPSPNPYTAPIVQHLKKLLTTKTGLSPTQATSKLFEALNANKAAATYGPIPPIRKQSLENWLARVIKTIPNSIVLHEASKISRHYRPPSNTGWPLTISND